MECESGNEKRGEMMDKIPKSRLVFFMCFLNYEMPILCVKLNHSATLSAQVQKHMSVLRII